MVSSTKADFDLRENTPLPRNTLHIWEIVASDIRGSERAWKASPYPTGYQDWLDHLTSPKVSASNPNYLADARDTVKNGMGRVDNRHLNYLAEFISVNVGDSCQNAKVSSPPMTDRRVGAVIVVRGWESQPQGEGPQSVGSSA
jgi:hypothetical protein